MTLCEGFSLSYRPIMHMRGQQKDNLGEFCQRMITFTSFIDLNNRQQVLFAALRIHSPMPWGKGGGIRWVGVVRNCHRITHEMLAVTA